MPFKAIDTNTIQSLVESGREKFGKEDFDQVYNDIILKYSIAESLQKAREESGKTQKDVAEMLKRKPQKISEYERGIKVPTILSLIEIAWALNCKFTIDPSDHEHPLQFICPAK